MTSVEQLIGDLLLRHNCVIVPSFGGFVAKQVPATIDFSKGTMLPPGKSLLFNKQLINNDGLLVNELSQKNSISYDSAVSIVQDKVNDWTKALKSGGRIELDRVGYLFLDNERNICFEQDRFFNLLLESFGLGTVKFVAEETVNQTIEEPKEIAKVISIAPVSNEELKEEPAIEIAEEKNEESAPVKPLNDTKRRSPIWRYVAAACILPVAFYSIWIPMKTDVLESGVLSINDFNPFYEAGEGTYEKQGLVGSFEENESNQTLQDQVDELPDDVSVYTYKLDDTQYVPVQLLEDEEVTSEVEPITSNDTEQFNPDAMNFIVGCFGNESNATNLVAKLKAQGFDAYVVDVHNGLHRVSAGSAISIEAFAQIKVAAQSQGYTGWTLK